MKTAATTPDRRPSHHFPWNSMHTHENCCHHTKPATNTPLSIKINSYTGKLLPTHQTGDQHTVFWGTLVFWGLHPKIKDNRDQGKHNRDSDGCRQLCWSERWSLKHFGWVSFDRDNFVSEKKRKKKMKKKGEKKKKKTTLRVDLCWVWIMMMIMMMMMMMTMIVMMMMTSIILPENKDWWLFFCTHQPWDKKKEKNA